MFDAPLSLAQLTLKPCTKLHTGTCVRRSPFIVAFIRLGSAVSAIVAVVVEFTEGYELREVRIL